MMKNSAFILFNASHYIFYFRSGLSPIDSLSDVKARQAAENNPNLGIDCMNNGKFLCK